MDRSQLNYTNGFSVMRRSTYRYHNISGPSATQMDNDEVTIGQYQENMQKMNNDELTKKSAGENTARLRITTRC